MRTGETRMYYVYIVASRARTLYIGFTSSLECRIGQHREKVFPGGFSSSYRCDRLVWFERFSDPLSAIAREKQLKRWRREKKEALIAKGNPTWEDLSQEWSRPFAFYCESGDGEADPSTSLRSGRDDDTAGERAKGRDDEESGR